MFRFIRKYVPVYQMSMTILVSILYLTLSPNPLGDEELLLFPGADKLAHFIMFGALTGAIIFDISRSAKAVSLPKSLLIAAGASLLGIFVEYLQATMAMGRSGNDMADAMANCIGAVTAVPICYLLGWIKAK